MSTPIPIILYLAFTFHATLAANYVPTEKILLSSGGPPTSTDIDGWQWTMDVRSKDPFGNNLFSWSWKLFAESVEKKKLKASW